LTSAKVAERGLKQLFRANATSGQLWISTRDKRAEQMQCCTRRFKPETVAKQGKHFSSSLHSLARELAFAVQFHEASPIDAAMSPVVQANRRVSSWPPAHRSQALKASLARLWLVSGSITVDLSAHTCSASGPNNPSQSGGREASLSSRRIQGQRGCGGCDWRRGASRACRVATD
jgi:hypothetical protein